MEHKRKQKSSRKGNGVDHDCIDPTYGTFLAWDGPMEWSCKNCGHANTSTIQMSRRAVVKCAQCHTEYEWETFLIHLGKSGQEQ